MQSFLTKHVSSILGVLSGFDRLVIRGSLLSLCRPEGMLGYLAHAKVLLKDFAQHVHEVSTRIKHAAFQAADLAGRPVQYLPSARTPKEPIARQIAEQHGIRDGLIALLTCTEPCSSFDIYRNGSTQRLELRRRQRQCLFLYRYAFHPRFGFYHARLQTWFPFHVQICLNGREWLARQLAEARLAYQRRDNALLWVEDFARAQQLADDQLHADWPSLLHAVLAELNPLHAQLLPDHSYYWSVHQSEYATDIAFRHPDALQAIYPRLLRHGLSTFASPDVLRFLGRRLPVDGTLPVRFQGEVTTDLKTRPEGVRLKHRLNANSIKMYDKFGQLLRIETTIQDPSDFRVYRPKPHQAQPTYAWLPLRKGMADLYRRAQVSRAANDRYLASLAVVDSQTPLRELAQRLCQPVRWNGRRVRALQPLAENDARLLAVIARGEFAINGLRNRDLRTHLYGADPSDAAEVRRRSGRASRLLRLLRAHGLIAKVPHTHRYVLTDLGRRSVPALLTIREISVDALNRLAA